MMRGYVQAMASAARGYVLRRQGWIEGEFIEYRGNMICQRYFAGREFCWRVYVPTHEDEFASDWELVA